MEELIYIIIGILWIVYSFYKKTDQAKKQAQKRAQTIENEEAESIQEQPSILDLLMQEMEPPKPQPIPQPIPQPKTITLEQQQKVSKNKTSKSNILDSYNMSDNTERQFKHKPALNNHNQKTIKPLIDANSFDARKAVIYSIIMERPNY